ncbi:Gfo/Idh/MocA family oxidoreductase [Halomonas binhaiensis]|uniref:Inositol 2-dehydrogenase n=1 Tax=Halomonas binhaiensis TaxID=2562282 RepID=A0A5C1NJJ3_9GAMM|nr:Gfo/Idh/MocA family oxidoreductase [Halomonas binhaiensis]QEM83484.1 Gfo/Idh/MocA family oxidoreductase [Halomonas binhaiensis]
MTVNIGIIGAGMIGEAHALRITQELTGARISAVADVDEANAHHLVERLGGEAHVYESGEALIAGTDVDAILVTSWGPTHEDYVIAAIQAGKPVFCEKPLATTAEGCQRIIEAEIAAGRRLVQVGYMRRFDTGYRKLKAVLDAGKLGEALMIHAAHRNAEVPERYITPMAIEDTLVHELDVLRWLLDDDFVSAQVVFPRKTRYAHDKVADPQIVLLETAKGVRIDVEVFVNCRYGYDIQCQLVGEEGIASLPQPESLEYRQAGRLSTDILQDWKDRFADAFSVELQAFIDGTASGDIQGPSSWDGLAAAVASDACVKAQQSGQIERIELPERPAFYA